MSLLVAGASLLHLFKLEELEPNQTGKPEVFFQWAQTTESRLKYSHLYSLITGMSRSISLQVQVKQRRASASLKINLKLAKAISLRVLGGRYVTDQCLSVTVVAAGPLQARPIHMIQAQARLGLGGASSLLRGALSVPRHCHVHWHPPSHSAAHSCTTGSESG